ncbi:MAG: hypothetical protein WHV67_02685 [Thermoanaerobaculia bacterium]
MRDLIISFSFILSVLIYVILAFVLKNTIKPVFPFQKDISIYFYGISFVIFLFALYLAKLKSFQSRLISLVICEIPPIFGFAYFIISGNLNILVRISIISILVMLYIIFLKGEKVEG